MPRYRNDDINATDRAWDRIKEGACQEQERQYRETYLGDGVYARYKDGMIELSAPTERGVQQIYLDHTCFLTLRNFAQRFWTNA